VWRRIRDYKPAFLDVDSVFEARTPFDFWTSIRFLLSRARRVFAASGVGCNDFGGFTGLR
jgi:hypothetical protein